MVRPQMQTSFLALLLMSLHQSSSASRIQSRSRAIAATEKQTKKCTISGPQGERASFPVKSCAIECVQATDWENESTTNEVKQFAGAFHVSLVQGKCICSHNSTPMLQFLPRSPEGVRSWDTGATKEHCEKDDRIAKEFCWNYYKMGRATNITMHPSGSDGEMMPIPERRMELYQLGNFQIHKSECSATPCTGDDCTEVELPSLISGLTSEVKAHLLSAVLAAKEKTGGSGGALVDFAKMLVDTDMDDLRFAEMDKNGDGELDLDELVAAYPGHTREEIEAFMKKVDLDGNGSISLDEFHQFRKFFYVKWEIGDLRCVHSVNGEIQDPSECLRSYEEAKAIGERHMNSLLLD